MRVCESFLRFDLPSGSRHHETVNATSTGVDLEVALDSVLLLVVKNWGAPVIPSHELQRQRASFVAKSTAPTFYRSIIRKFEGTLQSLANIGELPDLAVCGLLMEAEGITPADLGVFTALLQTEAANSTLAAVPIVVNNVSGWSGSFGVAPCPNVDGAEFVCDGSYPRCSYDKWRRSPAR